MKHQHFQRIKIEIRQRFLFFAKNSNINGLQQVARSSSVPLKCLWVAVLVASAGSLVLLLAPAGDGQGRLSYTPDTRYLRWATTFPAVTVCETFYVTAVQRKFTESLQFGNLVQNLTYNYRRYLTNLLYGMGACTKELCVPCGFTVPCNIPWRRIIEQIHMSCEDLIHDCAFNGAAFPCCARFRTVDAEHGPCYSFNTLQNRCGCADGTHKQGYSTSPLTPIDIRSLPFLSTPSNHRSLGMYLEISVHSPEELSTNNLDNKFKFDVKTREGNWVEFLFSLVEMSNDPLLKFEGVGVRGCRDLWEVPASPLHCYPASTSMVYSYGACMLAQSTEDSYSECGCVHPAREPAYKKKYCNYTGLNCLGTYEANKKLGIDSKKKHEPCLPSCSESELTTIHISKKWLPGNTEGTEVNIRMSSLPHLRYERHLLRSNLDSVVSVGGVVNLFFGASILSAVEVFYLLLRNPN